MKRRPCREDAHVTPRTLNQVDIPGWSTCTAELPDGSTCGAESRRNVPFPICDRHAVEVYRHVAKLMAEHALDSATLINAVSNVSLKRGRERVDSIALRADVMNGHPKVVYYARIGNHIKIGWTSDLTARMRHYPRMARLLAVEPGGRAVEGERHSQFGHLLDARAEWFRPGPDLMAHIAALAERGLSRAARDSA